MANIVEDANCLSHFLERHSRNERTVLIDKIMEECYVNRRTVYNWKYGLCRIPELYKRKIEEIFGSKIFNGLI